MADNTIAEYSHKLLDLGMDDNTIAESSHKLLDLGMDDNTIAESSHKLLDLGMDDNTIAESSHKLLDLGMDDNTIAESSHKLLDLGMADNTIAESSHELLDLGMADNTIAESSHELLDLGMADNTIAESSHELLDLGGSSVIKFFYIVYDYPSKEYPSDVTCFALNKATGVATKLTIPPAKQGNVLLMNYTAVAVGSTIYMIGGSYPAGLCPEDIDEIFHPCALVRYFDILRPQDGWREAAHMKIGRRKPTAVVIDGLIYVFGGSHEPFEYGEFYDPKTDQWSFIRAIGFEPYFACIQVLYVDSNGVKSVLVHSDCQNKETLFAYTLGSEKWEVISRDFVGCSRPGAILDGIIYVLRDREEQPLYGYHIMYKKWIPVELPELDSGIQVCPETAWVIPSGSDKLCLVWFEFDWPGECKDRRVECVELRLNKDYSYTEAGTTLTLTASKESRTCFRMPMNFNRISILAL